MQPGAEEVLARIRASGRRLVLFTNGSEVAPEAYAAGLRRAGLLVSDDELLTPLSSVQTYLHDRLRDGSVMLIGTAAAREYLVRAGVRVLAEADATSADAVFVAQPDVADLAVLEQAARAVLAGARLLTGSYASAYAGAEGPILSRGAMLTAAIAKASGARPVVVGKPSRAALKTISRHLGQPTEKLAVIGDDLALDVGLGRLGGSRTVLVRSGISGRVDLTRVPPKHRPDLVVETIAELLQWL